jgi:PAS domain S-box-containing protein
MKWAGGLLRVPGYRLVPLLLLAFALLALALNYGHQMRNIEQEVTAQEIRLLRERLSIEQTRLDIQSGMDNTLLTRRLVGGLALHQGLNVAYLVDAKDQVQASLSRLDIGRPLAQVLSGAGKPASALQALDVSGPSQAIEVVRDATMPVLNGLVPVQVDRRLLVQVDLTYPLAQRRDAVWAELALEGAVLLSALGVLAVALHLLWFRRAQRLASALSDMGAGNLTVRTALHGGDELALIGEAANRMASQLQSGQERIQRMSDIISRSPLVVIEWRNEPGWPVSYVSESIAQWGYATAELREGQQQYSNLIHPEDLPRITDEVAAHLAQGPDEYRQSYRIRCADGHWVWVDDRTSLTRDAQGAVVSISGILLDMTAQKEAELAQREQAELLRMFYELPFLGMAISSPAEKRWLQANDRLCEILGYPREELLRMTWAEMTPPGDLERNVALFDELLAGRRSGYRMAKRFVRKDGRIVHAEIDVRAVRDAAGQVKQLFATIQDVSERVAADEALRRSEAQLLEAQRIGRIGSWVYDVASGVSDWTEEMRRVHEQGPSTYATYLESVHPDDRARLDANFEAATGHGRPMNVSYRWRTPQGHTKHLRIKAEAVSEGGRIVSLQGLVQDETELVEAQRERDRLVSVMENTADIVSMADPQGHSFYFNRAGYELFGLPPGSVGEDTVSRVHPVWSAGQVVEEGIPTAVREGRWLGETAVIDAQGRERPMSQLIMVHRGADGQIEHLWTILRDITERKAAEAALNREHMQLNEAQMVARIGSWSVQLPEGRVSWSPHHFQLLGLDPAQVVPSVQAYLSVVHPDDLTRVRDHVEHLSEQAQGVVVKIEHRIVTPQGVRHVEERGSVERDADGHLVRLFGTTMDVTEQVLAERALRDAKDMLEQGEAVGRMGSFAYDSDTRDLRWSAQAFAIIGLPFSTQPPSVDGYCACIHPEDVEQVRSSIAHLIAGAEVPEVRFRTHPARGSVRWLRRVYQRIDRQAEGRGARYIGTLQDITETVKAEEQLRQINQELEQRVTARTEELSLANQELEAFSYTVSHDLKAPLRGIDGYSQLLVEEYGDRLDDEGKNFVRRIRQGVQQMGDLIADLLDYSRMERRGMSPEPVEMLPMVQHILQGYEADVQRQGVQVRLDMAPFSLSLDREGIAVVLRNLIGNAIKFSRDSQPPVIEIGSQRDGGRRVLWVRDNGVGFDPAYHERMFKIFQRLHRSEEFPGTGVGLALVAKAAQRMGGRVWAESTLGAGATFYLEFPE